MTEEDWANKALNNNKHVIVDKPLTINFDQTKKLVNLAITSSLPYFNHLAAVIFPKYEAIEKSNFLNLEASFILTRVPACILSNILGTAGKIEG